MVGFVAPVPAPAPIHPVPIHPIIPKPKPTPIPPVIKPHIPPVGKVEFSVTTPAEVTTMNPNWVTIPVTIHFKADDTVAIMGAGFLWAPEMINMHGHIITAKNGEIVITGKAGETLKFELVMARPVFYKPMPQPLGGAVIGMPHYGLPHFPPIVKPVIPTPVMEDVKVAFVDLKADKSLIKDVKVKAYRFRPWPVPPVELY